MSTNAADKTHAEGTPFAPTPQAVTSAPARQDSEEIHRSDVQVFNRTGDRKEAVRFETVTDDPLTFIEPLLTRNTYHIR